MSKASPSACTCPIQSGEHVFTPDTVAIIVAAGAGERFGNPKGKQFVDICGLPMLAWPLLAFERAPSVKANIVVCAPSRQDDVSAVIAQLTLTKPVYLVPGGATRQASVAAGLTQTDESANLIAVHDAARPLVSPQIIEDVCCVLRSDTSLAGAIAATRVTDTLKLVEDGLIISTPDRAFYWAAQTPQIFRANILKQAYRIALEEGFEGTDEAALVERLGGRVRCVECPRDNIKVTVSEDLDIVEATLRHRLAAEGGIE